MAKNTFDFDQGTRSLLGCFQQASADISVAAKSAESKLATLWLTLKNTGHNQTSRTLVQI